MALSICNSTADLHQKELLKHGSVDFPIACYEDDLSVMNVPWHWHDEFEYAIAAEGTPVFLLENARIQLKRGDGIFINSTALHAVEETSLKNIADTSVTEHKNISSGLHSAVFHPRLIGGSIDSFFWQKLIQPLLTNLSFRYIVLSQDIPWQKQILKHFHTVWEVVAEESEDYENEVRYQLSKGIRLLIDHTSITTKNTSEQEQTDAVRIRSMLEYIEKHYMEDLTIEDIAESISVSGSVCLRCFNQMLGTTPIQYVKQLRLGKAVEMLQNTSKTSKEIALECGFNDISYFTKSFREKNGCTPGVYRQNFWQKHKS